MHVAHLRCATSAPTRGRAPARARASPRCVGPNGQGKTNLVEAIGYLATLGSPPGRARTRRWCGSAPSARSCAPLVAATTARAGRAGDHAGQGQPGPGQPLAGPAAARGARRPAHGAVRARGPGAGQGRPGERRRFLDDLLVRARRGSPGCAPTTTGCSSSATRCSRPPARARPGRAAGDLRTLEVWDAHLATRRRRAAGRPARAGRRPAAAGRQGLRRGGRRRRTRPALTLPLLAR